MFDASIDSLEPEKISRYRLTAQSGSLTFGSILALWRSDAAFQDYFSNLLAESAFAGFRWETPPWSTESLDRPFEFVLVNAAGLATRESDRGVFSAHYGGAEEDAGVVSFANLGGDATLVVPSPRCSDAAYGHLATFVRRAPQAQVRALWRVLSRGIEAKLSPRPLWVSTAGGGVVWLHVRLDSRPKYYAYKAYKSA